MARENLQGVDFTPSRVKIMGKHNKKKDSLSVEEIEPSKKKKRKDREASLNLESFERGQDRPHEFMKKKKKKTKFKKDRSISSFFEEHVKGTSEVESRVKVKKRATGPEPYETEFDSDPYSLSDETKSGNVSQGIPSKAVNVSRNPSRNQTLLISINGAEEHFPIIFKDRVGQTWSHFLTNIKAVVEIPNRETLLITYKLHWHKYFNERHYI